jgi:hypothetical protein
VAMQCALVRERVEERSEKVRDTGGGDCGRVVWWWPPAKVRCAAAEKT